MKRRDTVRGETRLRLISRLRKKKNQVILTGIGEIGGGGCSADMPTQCFFSLTVFFFFFPQSVMSRP